MDDDRYPTVIRNRVQNAAPELDAIEDERLRSVIDAALGEIGSVRPTAHFLPRLRASLELSSRAPGTWLVRAVAAAVAIAAAVGVGHLSTKPFVAPDVVSEATPPRAAEPAVDRQARSSAQERSSLAFAARRGLARRRSREPARSAERSAEILIPAGQRQAVGRLFDALRAGRPEVISMLLSVQDEGAAVETAQELTIAPLRIDPVAISLLPEK